MGANQSLLTPETALTAAVVAGAMAFGYTQLSNNPVPSAPSSAVSSKKGKKKKLSPSVAEILASSSKEPAANPQPTIVGLPVIVPGSFDVHAAPVLESEPVAQPKKSKKKKTKSATTIVPGGVSSTDNNSDTDTKVAPFLIDPSSSLRAKKPTNLPQSSHLKTSSASVDTDGSWTRVESRRGTREGSRKINGQADVMTSDTGVTSSVTDTSSVAERTDDEALPTLDRSTESSGKQKTLAEKLLPKPRKTGVDDMLETSDYPEIARVMRVQPRADEKPAAGFQWGDYEDDGWGVVQSKRPKPVRTASSQPEIASQQSGEMTQKQRQNAKKREALKTAKSQAEADRLATLARHKKELERAKMAEQFSGKGGKTPSGGMRASVDGNGKLIWED